jgi:hypothetical protein
MMQRLYWAYAVAAHILTFGHWPVWAVPGLWCQECAFRKLQ